jgi:hypothetical protein
VLANSVEIPAKRSRHMRGKTRLRTIQALDGRTLAAKRAHELAQGFVCELGGTITASQRLAIERAAALAALSEDAQARRLSGSPDITLEDLVRIDNAAMRAVKALGIKPAAAPKPSILAEHLAGRAAERAGVQTAHGAPTNERTHRAPPQDDGGALEERAATSGGDLP